MVIFAVLWSVVLLIGACGIWKSPHHLPHIQLTPLYNYLWSFHHWTFLFGMFFALTHLTEDRYRGVRLQYFTTQFMYD